MTERRGSAGQPRGNGDEALERHDGDCASAPPVRGRTGRDGPDLGDLVVVLLASTLAGLRDRLAHDGFEDAAALVADLVEAADDYIVGCQR
jgi:hypothetical protein